MFFRTFPADLDTCDKHTECRKDVAMARLCPLSKSTDATGIVKMREDDADAEGYEPVATFRTSYSYERTLDDGSIQMVESNYYSMLCVAGVGVTVDIDEESWHVYDDYRTSVYAWIATGLTDEPFRRIYVCDGDHRDLRKMMTVDASADMIAEYRAYNARLAERARQIRIEQDRIRQHEARVRAEGQAEKGKLVRVVSGRTIPKGTIGRCTWVGDTKYGWRVGFKVSPKSETQWIALKHIEVIVLDELVMEVAA